MVRTPAAGRETRKARTKNQNAFGWTVVRKRAFRGGGGALVELQVREHNLAPAAVARDGEA